MTDRMVFPVEGFDFETLCYDVENLTRDAINLTCSIFGLPDPIDVDAVLASVDVETVLLDAVNRPEQGVI